jgi:hypothetical protein
MDFDNLVISPIEHKILPIKIFLDNEIDNIIDLFKNLTDRFYYLFGCRSEKLTEFLVENLFEINDKGRSKWECRNESNYPTNSFINDNYNEINFSLNIINTYLASKKYIKRKININNLIEFCFSLSN